MCSWDVFALGIVPGIAHGVLPVVICLGWGRCNIGGPIGGVVHRSRRGAASSRPARLRCAAEQAHQAAQHEVEPLAVLVGHGEEPAEAHVVDLDAARAVLRQHPRHVRAAQGRGLREHPGGEGQRGQVVLVDPESGPLQRCHGAAPEGAGHEDVPGAFGAAQGGALPSVVLERRPPFFQVFPEIAVLFQFLVSSLCHHRLPPFRGRPSVSRMVLRL